MKLIVLALCVFIALASVDNAAGFYRCVDKDGDTIITDNPPPGAKCEGRVGHTRSAPVGVASSPANDTRSELNAKIEALIDKLSVQTYDSRGNPHSMKNEKAQIVELRKAQLRNQGNHGDVGIEMSNQQDDLDKMKRQQSEMENEMKHQKIRMDAQRMRQEAEIHRLQHEQRMQEMNKAFGP